MNAYIIKIRQAGMAAIQLRVPAKTSMDAFMVGLPMLPGNASASISVRPA
jgi:hypothetical protein